MTSETGMAAHERKPSAEKILGHIVLLAFPPAQKYMHPSSSPCRSLALGHMPQQILANSSNLFTLFCRLRLINESILESVSTTCFPACTHGLHTGLKSCISLGRGRMAVSLRVSARPLLVVLCRDRGSRPVGDRGRVEHLWTEEPVDVLDCGI